MAHEGLDNEGGPMGRSTRISVVIPIYKEEANTRPLLERLEKVFEGLGCAWEVVFALDPSPDGTERVIRELMDEGRPIRLLKFSRRIGKPLSLMAGLEHAAGDAVVILDADLQDPPELIETMIAEWRKGYKVVIAQRTSRKGESFLYLKCAELYYRLLEKISEVPVPRNTGDFRLLDARVVRELCKFRERHGFLRGMTASVGFSTALVPFDRDPRQSGKTQISWLGAVNIALDGIIPFSRAPLRAVALSGLVGAVIAVCLGAAWLVWGMTAGFSSACATELLCILVIGSTGFVLGALGITGEYLVRTYEETRDRPLYIIDELIDGRGLSRMTASTNRRDEDADRKE